MGTARGVSWPRIPDLFAAAVPSLRRRGARPPVAGDPQRIRIERLLLAHAVPIRAFRGELDALVPCEESRLLARVLEAVGGDVELTVYPDVEHDSWTKTYEQRELWSWMFAQRRN